MLYDFGQAVMLTVMEFWTLDQVSNWPCWTCFYREPAILRLIWNATCAPTTGAASPRTHLAPKKMAEEDSDSEDFDEELKEMNYIDISLETFV